MYVWNYTQRTGWQLKRIGAQSPSTLPSNFQIWREDDDGRTEMIIALDNYKAVISIMAKLEQAEKNRGATTMAHPESMSIGAVGGFSACTQQMVIMTNDGSGKPRYRMADAPSVHYWVEQVLPEQCDIENARYAQNPRHVRENRA